MRELRRRDLTRAREILARYRGTTDFLLGGRHCLTPRAPALLRALKEAFAYHFLAHPDYRLHCQNLGFFPADLRSPAQLSQIPYLREAARGPLEGLERQRFERIVGYVYADLALTSPRRTDYLCLAGEQLTRLTRVNRLLTGLQERGSRPVRVVGPVELIEPLLSDLRPGLAEHSYVLVGPSQGLPVGFRERVAGALGIPLANVREFYAHGLYGVPHCACERGGLHVPRASLVLVRDPITMEPLGFGQTGLLQLLTPYPTGAPALSLLTCQRGRLERHCPCGRPSPILTLPPLSRPEEAILTGPAGDLQSVY